MKTALIYARVSSDRQREEHTIASQTAALRVFAQEQGFSVPSEWVIEDEGYSGATLVRPGLERVRDLVAEGQRAIRLKSNTMILRVNICRPRRRSVLAI
jgi:site-specific DNA recombinase